MRVVEELERFVGAGVEHAHDNLLAGEVGEEPGVLLALLFDSGCHALLEEEELGSEEADTLRSGIQCLLRAVGRSEVGEERYRCAVGEGSRIDTAGEGGRALVDASLGIRSLGVVRGDRDGSGACVDDHLGPVGERVRTRHPDDRNDRLLAGEDRGVRCRSTLPGDEGQHLIEIEERRIGRRQVVGDQHVGLVGLRHARRWAPGERRDDPLRHVVEVARALPHVAAQVDEHVAEDGEALEDRALGRLAGGEPLRDVVGEGRVLRHHRLGLENVGSGSGHGGGPGAEIGGDDGNSLGHASALFVRGARARLIGGLGKRCGHPEHSAQGDALPDAGAGERFRCDVGHDQAS